jgi:hypothetical protein
MGAYLSGHIFEVVELSASDHDGDTQVWVAEGNIRRSASPWMRQRGGLVEQPSNDCWWCAVGVQHRHRRGSWLPVSTMPECLARFHGVFMNWLVDRAAVKSR